MNSRLPYEIGFDTEATTLREADHLLHRLAAELAFPEGGFACTHLMRGERPHVALSFSTTSRRWVRSTGEQLAAGGYDVSPAAPDAAGRAVLYPGVSALTGTVTIAELLAASAIDDVIVLGAPGAPDPHQLLMTQDHVRPTWKSGELILATMPAAGGVLIPFEVPNPTPCCADH